MRPDVATCIASQAVLSYLDKCLDRDVPNRLAAREHVLLISKLKVMGSRWHFKNERAFSRTTSFDFAIRRVWKVGYIGIVVLLSTGILESPVSIAEKTSFRTRDILEIHIHANIHISRLEAIVLAC